MSNQDLELALTLADAADQITLTRFRARDLRVARKPDRTPVTDADLALGELRVRDSARPNDLERFSDYSETVRTEIQRALLKNPQSATGNYRAVLDLWIDPSRAIRKASLLNPTGDNARDVAITSTLQGLMISRPPPSDAPQPIRAVVAVSTSK